MMRDHVRDLLERVAAGGIAPEAALNLLATPQVEQLPFATIDHHRGIRQGFPEVIYGEGKTDRQIVEIAKRIVVAGDTVLVTRAATSAAELMRKEIDGVEWNELGRTLLVRGRTQPPTGRGTILIVTAGTSDLPVAEEAAVTADATGNQDMAFDVRVQ